MLILFVFDHVNKSSTARCITLGLFRSRICLWSTIMQLCRRLWPERVATEAPTADQLISGQSRKVCGCEHKNKLGHVVLDVLYSVWCLTSCIEQQYAVVVDPAVGDTAIPGSCYVLCYIPTNVTKSTKMKVACSDHIRDVISVTVCEILTVELYMTLTLTFRMNQCQM